MQEQERRQIEFAAVEKFKAAVAQKGWEFLKSVVVPVVVALVTVWCTK